MLNIHNVQSAKNRLENYNPETFNGVQNSFRDFLYKIEIDDFRHIKDLEVQFKHPVTVVSGTNKIGKTSILLLIACSHIHFKKYDSTKPDTELRDHSWGDVLSFTNYETVNNNYVYRLFWRKGNENRDGEGKRLATSRAWSGLGKKSSDENRINAKIREREVRFIDLERVVPARNFSNSLLRKITSHNTQTRLSQDIEHAFSFIFDLPQNTHVYEIGSHVNKIAYLIENNGTDVYSSYNAASGEEAILNVLVDIFNASENSLIIIDEIEAGLHPTIQRKLADIIQYVSWHHKKQFIITTHSPTLLSSFPQKSRVFIDKNNQGEYRAIHKISKNAALSKMDAFSHPLIHLYCEDKEAEFIIRNLLIELNREYQHFDRLVNIIKSGAIDQVKNDYQTHKKNYSQMRIKTGYCGVFDGDYRNDPNYSIYHNNDSEFTFFLYPYRAPEKFLVTAYLSENPHQQLQSALNYTDHHALFQEMANLGIAANRNQARELCWDAFSRRPEFNHLKTSFDEFIIQTVTHFSEKSD